MKPRNIPCVNIDNSYRISLNKITTTMCAFCVELISQVYVNKHKVK